MNPETLKAAVGLAQKAESVLIASADLDGRPHIAVAKDIDIISEDQIVLKEWFCPGTIDNIIKNKHVSVVIWDALADRGYQLSGDVEKIEDMLILDGFAPEMENQAPSPQVERELLVKINKVIEFKQVPHSDVEN